jgi:hypothetical protein
MITPHNKSLTRSQPNKKTKMIIHTSTPRWLYTGFDSHSELLDQDFDAENDNYRPTADTLDHIQPHYRVTLPA